MSVYPPVRLRTNTDISLNVYDAIDGKSPAGVAGFVDVLKGGEIVRSYRILRNGRLQEAK
jgi:hypothetical protein